MFKSLAPALCALALALPALAQSTPPAPEAPARTLSGAEWQVSHLSGLERIEGDAPTISFGADLRVAGASGCNRYMGGYAQDGLALKFTELAGTMMACPEPRMALEQRMLGALSEVTHFSLTEGGALELFGPAGLLLRATR